MKNEALRTIAIALGMAGCAIEADDHDELDPDRSGAAGEDAPLGIVTFNVGMEDDQSRYEALRGLLDDSDRILVLQEVDDVAGMRSALSADFPYEYVTENYTDKKWDWGCVCRRRKRTNVVVRSKLPIVHQESALIQTDPGGDRWRRHAQYVRIKVGDDENIHLFHYHNTYNWHHDSSAAEKSGMESFKGWVESTVGPLSSGTSEVFMAGDFNLVESALDDILGTSLTYHSDWVDHIVSTSVALEDGGFEDASAISDHDLVWGEFDLVSNIATAERHVVRLYEHSGFEGLVTAFERGSVSNIGTARGEWWNDRISSMKVGADVRLHAWEHHGYGGTKWCLPAQGECSASGHGDAITSLEVMSR